VCYKIGSSLFAKTPTLRTMRNEFAKWPCKADGRARHVFRWSVRVAISAEGAMWSRTRGPNSFVGLIEGWPRTIRLTQQIEFDPVRMDCAAGGEWSGFVEVALL